MSEFYIEDKIRGWDKKEMVRFSLFCCYKVKHLMDDKSLELIKLTEQMKDGKIISEEESRKAASNLYYDNDGCYDNTSYISRHVAGNAFYVAYNTDYTNSLACTTAYTASRALNSSEEMLYLEYMRSKLSDIMEG